MKNLIKKITGLSIASIIMFCFAEAQNVAIGEPTYGGTGCPAGSLSGEVSRDGSEIFIQFGSFIVESGRSSRHRIDRGSCSFTIPITVPEGYSVALLAQSDFSVNVERGASVQRDVEIFYAGARFENQSKIFRGPLSQDLQEVYPEPEAGVVWTPCGKSVNLRMNMSLLTQGSASAVMRGVNMKVVQWKKCE
ncbi:MAG TPA: DUF4360 domain-containing protein [Pseudobdellovibrionaceae bacterium]|nr:DUF4360 domain-containing protein [Pseudobdellovibrionaceae bacterium]